MPDKEVEIKIFGKVQDVGFRYSALHEATALFLAGYVKNLEDGSVQIIAQGDEKSLNQLVSWVKIGPRFANVDKITADFREPTVKFKIFEIRY